MKEQYICKNRKWKEKTISYVTVSNQSAGSIPEIGNIVALYIQDTGWISIKL